MANRVVVIAITKNSQLHAGQRLERVIQAHLCRANSRLECQACFGHRASNPKRF
jgi:hypothetical protein